MPVNWILDYAANKHVTCTFLLGYRENRFDTACVYNPKATNKMFVATWQRDKGEKVA